MPPAAIREARIAAHRAAGGRSSRLWGGFLPLPGFAVPSYGAVASKLLGPRSALPPYISIQQPGSEMGAGTVNILDAAQQQEDDRERTNKEVIALNAA